VNVILDVQDIHTAYGLSRVLFGVSLQVAAGECVCLLGRNGVGKTTTIRSIMGLTPPRAGRVVWKGRDITGWPPYRVARAGIGFVPEDRRIFAELTVWENLDVATRARRPGDGDAPATSAWTIERVFDLFPKLRELRDRPGGFLSGGEQQMLTIARTLMGNPELLLLDEPSEGLAPLVVDHLREQVARLKGAGLTILLAEQNTEFSLALADRAYVLEKGAIRFAGPAATLRDDSTLRHELLAL
jgi:branched-chain amino acid transport system ATP-binding protein